MTRKLVSMVWLLAPLALACADPKESEGDGAGSNDGTDETGTGDETTGGPDSSAECDMYLECIMKVDPDNAGMAEEQYGPGGSCWAEETADECSDDCTDFTGELVEDFPNALECGGDPLCPGQCCEKNTDCNPDNPCCEGFVCFQDGATACLCLDMAERCNSCMSECQAVMMPELCPPICKTWCMPDLDYDPIHCRSWE